MLTCRGPRLGQIAGEPGRLPGIGIQRESQVSRSGLPSQRTSPSQLIVVDRWCIVTPQLEIPEVGELGPEDQAIRSEDQIAIEVPGVVGEGKDLIIPEEPTRP